MNTVFKFHFETWLLFSLAGAIAWETFRSSKSRAVARRDRPRRRRRRSSRTVTAFAGFLRLDRGGWPRVTLDGTAYLEKQTPGDRGAIEWINANVRGLPVLLEAQGPPYQEFTRLSMHTGLPTVQGWEYHTLAARPQPGRDRPPQGGRHGGVHLGGRGGRQADPPSVPRRARRRRESRAQDVRGREPRAVRVVDGSPDARLPESGVRPLRGEGRLFARRGGGARARRRAARPRRGKSRRRPPPPADAAGPRAPAPGSGIGRGRARLGRGFRQPAGAALRRGRLFPPRVRDARQRARTVQRPVRRRGRPVRPRLRGGHVERPRAGLRRRRAPGCANGAAASSARAASPWTRAARSSSRTRGTGASCASTASGTRRPSGARRQGPGKLADPQGLAAGKDGSVYVADNGNGRVAVFDRDGGFLRAFDVPGWRRESPLRAVRRARCEGAPVGLGAARGRGARLHERGPPRDDARAERTSRRARSSRSLRASRSFPRDASSSRTSRGGSSSSLPEVKRSKRGPAPGRPRVQEVSRDLRRTRGRRDGAPAGSASRCPFRTWGSRRTRRSSGSRSAPCSRAGRCRSAGRSRRSRPCC